MQCIFAVNTGTLSRTNKLCTYSRTLICCVCRAGMGPYSDVVSLKVEPSLLLSPALPPSHSGGGGGLRYKDRVANPLTV